jgi:hypothetical protein
MSYWELLVRRHTNIRRNRRRIDDVSDRFPVPWRKRVVRMLVITGMIGISISRARGRGRWPNRHIRYNPNTAPAPRRVRHELAPARNSPVRKALERTIAAVPSPIVITRTVHCDE